MMVEIMDLRFFVIIGNDFYKLYKDKGVLLFRIEVWFGCLEIVFDLFLILRKVISKIICL